MKKRLVSSRALQGIVATLTISLLATFVNVGAAFTPLAHDAHAACAPLDTSRGVVTSTVNIPQTGNYRVWARIMAPDSTNNSFYLEVDGTTCGVVVGDNAITANSWRWVDYKDGSTSSKINLNLTAGNHTIRMVGREDDVQVDRMLFLSDTSCVPSGTGDNCADSTSGPSGSTLQSGEQLQPGEELTSSNGNYRATLQGDGNFVVYSPTKALWSSKTAGKAANRLVLQSDGNLVLYNPSGSPLWHTQTNGRGSSRLVMQNDGNLVLYTNGSNEVTWHTKTAQ